MYGKIWINLAFSACTALVVLSGGTTSGQQTPDASANNGNAVGSGAASSGAASTADPVAAATAILTNPSVSLDQQEDAARKLVARHSADSRAAILQILNDRPPAPRIALAKALADDPDTDTDFINPLFVMMTTEQRGSIDAAAALGSYKNNPALLLRLADFSSDPRHGDQRISAITALGYMVDRRAAEQLVTLLSHEDEDPGVRGASAEALGEMTGLNYGTDFSRWEAWWTANQNKSPDQFRLDMLYAKAVQLDVVQAHAKDVQAHYHDFLEAEYQALPQDQQSAKLLSYLTTANDPVMRQTGAEIVRQAKLDVRPVPQDAMVQLRKMISDTDPHVRQAVVDALQAMNDREALQPLLNQLKQETDPNVRASIADAFGPIGDLKAVKPLLKLLDDSTPAVAVAAAKSLADLAPALHASDPATAAQAAKKLQAALERSGNTGMQSLRDAVVGAMAELRDPSLADTYRDLLKPGESVSVRRNALLGLGYLNNRNDDALIGQSLKDPDPSVREAAIASEKDVHFAPQLVTMLGPNADTQAVQTAAWNSLQAFLPEITDTQELANFADQFRDWNQWDRRLTCLQRLADVYQKAGNHADDLADTDENIGQCQEKQVPPDYKGAAASYAAAMTIKEQEPGHNDEVISRLIDDRLKATLRAGDIDGAMAFAQQAMGKYPTKKGDIGAIINDEAERLKNDGNQNPAQLDNAITLIDGALKLNPALPDQYQRMLHDTKTGIQGAQAGKKGTNGVLYPLIGGATARAGS